MNVPSLTGVRGIAALWVVSYHVELHAGAYGLPALALLPVARSGWAGVDLFFILSGFILMLVHEADFQRLSWPALGRFAWLRGWRLYPLSVVVLGLIALLALADPGFRGAYATATDPPNFTLGSFVRTVFLATRWWWPYDGDWNQPVWSLSVEIVGYCAFPFVAWAAARMRQRWVLIGLAVACLFFPIFVFWSAMSRMAAGMAAGIVIARLHRLTPDGQRSGQGMFADIALLVIVAALFIPAGETILTPLFGALIFGLASGRGVANRLFSSPISVRLGEISFPLYLVHVMPLLWLVYGFGAYPVPHGELLRPLCLALYVLFCLSLALLLHVYVELPANRLARQQLRRWWPISPRGAVDQSRERQAAELG